MTRGAAALLALAVLSADAASGQPAAPPTCEASDFDCAQYWTACELLGETFVGVDDDAPVTEDRLRNAVESRLRGARLLNDTGGGPSLNVTILTVVAPSGQASSVLSVGISKRMFDGALGVWTLTERYPETLTILHGKDNTAFVMDAFYGVLDQIINNYLRVNGPACSWRNAR